VDIAVDNFVDNSVGLRELRPELCGYLVGRRRYSCGPEVARWLCFTWNRASACRSTRFTPFGTNIGRFTGFWKLSGPYQIWSHLAG